MREGEAPSPAREARALPIDTSTFQDCAIRSTLYSFRYAALPDLFPGRRMNTLSGLSERPIS